MPGNREEFDIEKVLKSKKLEAIETSTEKHHIPCLKAQINYY